VGAISKADLETGVKAILMIAEQAGINLPGLLHEDPMAGVPDVTFTGIKEALAAAPDTYQSENVMRWKLRHRHKNGLMDAGAVTENFNGPKNARATYTINHRRWVAHERGIALPLTGAAGVPRLPGVAA
jgi:hypothetical protein